jgi:hypothetical protein
MDAKILSQLNDVVHVIELSNFVTPLYMDLIRFLHKRTKKAFRKRFNPKSHVENLINTIEMIRFPHPINAVIERMIQEIKLS